MNKVLKRQFMTGEVREKEVDIFLNDQKVFSASFGKRGDVDGLEDKFWTEFLVQFDIKENQDLDDFETDSQTTEEDEFGWTNETTWEFPPMLEVANSL